MGSLNKDKIYFRIRISVEGTMVFKNIIKPHVLPIFRYKLDDDPVTTDPKGEGLKQFSPIRRPLS